MRWAHAIGIAGLGAVAAMLVLATFMLAGFGKLSAAQTAQKLITMVAPHARIRCTPQSGPWQYSCRITLPRGSGVKPLTTDVMVDSHHIVDIGG